MPMTKPTSEQVTFLAAGSGASQRTVLDKLRDTFNVLDYAVGGFVPNNPALDFSPTFNAAIAAVAAAGGGTLEFPKENFYFLTRPAEIYGGINLRGNRTTLHKYYVENGSGTHAGAEGVKRGVFSFDGNQNNGTFIDGFSFYNYAAGGSAISLVADVGDSNGPGLIWISNVHCSGGGTGNPAPDDYYWWEACIYIDGSEARTGAAGVRGVWIENCPLFLGKTAAIESYATGSLVVSDCWTAVLYTTGASIKCDGGLKDGGGVGVTHGRIELQGCNFPSPCKFGTESSVTHAAVEAVVMHGYYGTPTFGAQMNTPPIFLGRVVAGSITSTSGQYTAITDNGQRLEGNTTIDGLVTATGAVTAEGRVLANNSTATGIKYDSGSTIGIACAGAVDAGIAALNIAVPAGQSVRFDCGSAKFVQVSDGNGNACLAFADYQSSTVSLVSNPSSVYTNATGTANRISITKAATSHTIRVMNEFTATRNIGIAVFGSTPSTITLGV